MAKATEKSRPPLMMMAEDKESFRYKTLVERCPRIIDGVAAANAERFGPGVCNELRAFAEGLREDGKFPVLALPHATGPYFSVISEYFGKPWRETPWLHGECYIYHHLYHITKAFDENKGYDFFATDKAQSISVATEAMKRSAKGLLAHRFVREVEEVIGVIKASLWGNRVDLCLFSITDESRLAHADDNSLLVNDAEAVAGHLLSGPPGRIDLIADNHGFELFSDLCLAYHLRRAGIAEKVVVHLKVLPYFVSDASIKDAEGLLGMLRESDDESLRDLGIGLTGLVTDGSLEFRDNIFWNAPAEFTDMPEELRVHFEGSKLTVVKGDLNYRKLVGDRHWPRDAPFAEAVGYFPSPVVALRTGKSEVVVGVPLNKQEEVAKTHPWPLWAVGGDFGVIQLHLPK